MYVCMQVEQWPAKAKPRQADFPFPSCSTYHVHAISIGSSTYVGMITVRRAEQSRKAPSDMVTREVGRDTLVRAESSRRESYKRTRQVRKIKTYRRYKHAMLALIFYTLT